MICPHCGGRISHPTAEYTMWRRVSCAKWHPAEVVTVAVGCAEHLLREWASYLIAQPLVPLYVHVDPDERTVYVTNLPDIAEADIHAAATEAVRKLQAERAHAAQATVHPTFKYAQVMPDGE